MGLGLCFSCLLVLKAQEIPARYIPPPGPAGYLPHSCLSPPLLHCSAQRFQFLLNAFAFLTEASPQRKLHRGGECAQNTPLCTPRLRAPCSHL